MADDDAVLRRAFELATDHLQGLPERRVGATAGSAELRSALGGELPEGGEPPVEVLERLVDAADPGLVASPGPRYFGFVVGGAVPVTVAADWLVSAWDQNAAAQVMAPAVAALEEVCGVWLLELLGLPEDASIGYVTGGQGANTTCLAAARHAVLRDAGWDVEEQGLAGAPPVEVVVGDDAHATIFTALRVLGLGASRARRIPTDDQGRMDPPALATALAEGDGPAIVCAQAGEVNTGAFDAFEPIADACAERGAWLHVDGAFGLWARATPRLRDLARGAERADSWATDAHKFLNVPYDLGLAFVRDPSAHAAVYARNAAYLHRSDVERDPAAFVPEASRRARSVPLYAVLRTLGRRGVADLVERCCALARQMAAELDEEPSVRILNDVVLNQVLVGLNEPARTADVIAAVQADGTCWLGGTEWHGSPAIRVAISNWSTTPEDVTRSAAAIAAAVRGTA